MLFVATRWVAAVYAVNHPTSDPPGPRLKWRDATLLHRLIRPPVVGEPAHAGIASGQGAGCVVSLSLLVVADSGGQNRRNIGQSLPISSGTGRRGTIPALAVNTPCGVRTTTWQVPCVRVSPCTHVASMGGPSLPPRQVGAEEGRRHRPPTVAAARDAAGDDAAGDDKVVKGDDKVVKGDDKVVKGDDKVVKGDDKVVKGDDKVVKGDDKVVKGDDKVVKGDDKVVKGDDKVVKGDDKVVKGDDILLSRVEY
ncbi:unnamed protein product [Boreogadus saida]